MCFWKLFSIFICITTSAWTQKIGGSLHCPPEWIAGTTITLELLIDESLFPSSCKQGTDNRPYFQRKTSASGLSSANCTAPDITTSCGTFTPHKLGCGCIIKNGSYVLQYNFIAHPDYNGWWSADIPCPDSSANPELIFTANNCEDKIVKNDSCDSYVCKSGGVCYNGTGVPACNCSGTYHYGDQCEYDACANYSGPATCAISDSDPSKPIYICDCFYEGKDCTYLSWCAWLILCLCIGLALSGIWNGVSHWIIRIKIYLTVIFIYIKLDKTKCQAAKEEVKYFISENSNMCCSWWCWCCYLAHCCMCIFCGRCSKHKGSDGKQVGDAECHLTCVWCWSSVGVVDVDVNVHCVEDDYILILITLKATLSWYFRIMDMPAKIKQFLTNYEEVSNVRSTDPTGGGAAPSGKEVSKARSIDPTGVGPAPGGKKGSNAGPSVIAGIGIGCCEVEVSKPRSTDPTGGGAAPGGNRKGSNARSTDPTGGGPAPGGRHSSNVRSTEPSGGGVGPQVAYKTGNPGVRIEPAVDYPDGKPKPQTKYTGKGNGQPKKSKSDKEIPLSSVGRSSPPSETSGDEKTLMIPPTKKRALPVPANQHETTSTGIGNPATPRLDPLKQDHSKMTSVERNSGAFPRTLPSPGQLPLDPIPSGKKS